ncbi:MAG: replicative DNA helicase [Acidobacteriota bacterium]|jgi:replicative DNA helicase
MAEVTRLLPHSKEAEGAILGAIMLECEAVHTALSILTPDDFYLELHRNVFQVMSDFAKEGKSVDYKLLKMELERRDQLKAGDVMDIMALTDGMPRGTNVEHYARIVKEKAALRKVIQASDEALSRSFQPEEDSQEIITDITKRLYDIAGDLNKTDFRSMADSVNVAYKQMEYRAEHKNEVTGISSGFAWLDRMTTGFQPGDYDVIAARPGMGKTSLALNIASHTGLTGKRVAVFSLEMTFEQLVNRMLCAEAEVDLHRVATGNMTKEDWSRMGRASSRLSEAKIMIDDSAGLSITELRAKAMKLKLRDGLDLVVVDYLQLLTSGSKRLENRNQEISLISRELKKMAKELGVPVIALSQLNREIENRKTGPQLSDLRESGSIEQDADLVLFIHQDKEQREQEQERDDVAPHQLIIGKQRNGPTGKIDMAFIKIWCRFRELYKEDDDAAGSTRNAA